MHFIRHLIRHFWILVFIFIAGCQTAPTVAPVENTQSNNLKLQSFGSDLGNVVEGRMKIVRDPEISIYLNKASQNLVRQDSAFQDASLGIGLIRPLNKKWMSVGIPRARIYLPVELLKKIQHDNELMAAIAVQLGHLQMRHVLIHMDELLDGKDPQKKTLEGLLKNLHVEGKFDSLDYFGSDGVFSFKEEFDVAAYQYAVRILYGAGYDVRGVTSLLKIYEQNIEFSPYDLARIHRIVEAARREISSFAPIRNPVVRTRSFFNLQKRIQKL